MSDELPPSSESSDGGGGSCCSSSHDDSNNINNEASNNSNDNDDDDDISITLQEVQIVSPNNNENDNVESYLPNMSSLTLDISNPYFVPMRRTSIDAAIIESRNNTDVDDKSNHFNQDGHDVKGDMMENNSDVVKLTATKNNNTAVRRKENEHCRRNNNNLNGLNLSSTSRDLDSLLGDASTNLCSSSLNISCDVINNEQRQQQHNSHNEESSLIMGEDYGEEDDCKKSNKNTIQRRQLLLSSVNEKKFDANKCEMCLWGSSEEEIDYERRSSGYNRDDDDDDDSIDNNEGGPSSSVMEDRSSYCSKKNETKNDEAVDHNKSIPAEFDDLIKLEGDRQKEKKNEQQQQHNDELFATRSEGNIIITPATKSTTKEKNGRGASAEVTCSALTVPWKNNNNSNDDVNEVVTY